MKVLTIRQPWASLIMAGLKEYEFRSWKTNYRGEILIHAGKTIGREAEKRLKKYLSDKLPTGKILGKVNLMDCIKVTPQFLSELRKVNPDIYTKSVFKEEYAWNVTVLEKFDKPIAIKGKLSLWNYSDKEKRI